MYIIVNKEQIDLPFFHHCRRFFFLLLFFLLFSRSRLDRKLLALNHGLVYVLLSFLFDLLLFMLYSLDACINMNYKGVKINCLILTDSAGESRNNRIFSSPPPSCTSIGSVQSHNPYVYLEDISYSTLSPVAVEVITNL